MTTYAQYQQQIAELQKLAETARKTEAADGVNKIRQLMSDYGLTVADIETSSKQKSAKPRSSVSAKYRNEETGQTWTGRGRSPKWLDGKDKAQFLIK